MPADCKAGKTRMSSCWKRTGKRSEDLICHLQRKTTNGYCCLMELSPVPPVVRVLHRTGSEWIGPGAKGPQSTGLNAPHPVKEAI